MRNPFAKKTEAKQPEKKETTREKFKRALDEIEKKRDETDRKEKALSERARAVCA